MAGKEHPRHIIRNLIPLHVCKELEFIHKSNCSVGYRAGVFSTTLSHLIATNCPHLIMPFVHLRETLKEKAEELFDCPFELFVEFTGLISWTKGASIGWHSDDNRPYLKQRDFAAVCYLNNFGKDFRGGLFHFQEGEPTTIVPMAGDVVMYTADVCNIHSVDEITDGERLTLTLWFSRDSSHDEDAKLVSLLSQYSSNHVDIEPSLCIPFPASSNMYWFSSSRDPQQACDIRFARLLTLGFDLYCSEDNSYSLEFNSSDDISELLMKPLQLVKGDELFTEEFVNVLHVLQVVQFYFWRESDLQTSEIDRSLNNVVPLSQAGRKSIETLKLSLMKDMELVEASFSYSNRSCQDSFDWARFSAATAAWKAYASMAELKHFKHPMKADGSLSFLVIGDWGRKGLYNQSLVAAQMGLIGGDLDIDFVISTGDNFYENGLTGVDDPAFRQSFSDIYTAPSLQKQWYSVLGNHDYRGNVEAQLSPVLRLKDKRWLCLRSFIVNAEIVDFFFLDTTPFVEQYFKDPGKHTYDWRGIAPRKKYIAMLLKDVNMALKRSSANWKIVVGHHTIKSAGHHGIVTDLVSSLLPILKENRVDFYLNGHDHCLEQIISLDSNTQFLTSGGGSKAWRGDIEGWNPKEELKFYYDGQGFMSVQMNASVAKFMFYDIFGNVLHQWDVPKQLHSSI
ncbi:hypothetical protein Ancab_018351 [Ancistrocladus abbreviatus]